MKIFKVFAIVCLFFLMIGCEDSPKRLVSIDESGDVSDTSDTTSSDTDSADTPDTDNPDTGAPDTDTSDTDNPDTGAPDTDSPDTDNPDTGTPDTDSPDTDNPDTDSSDTDSPDSDSPDTGSSEQKYCSAVFNGSTSKVEVAHNDVLNLTSETWTIEAWIKQTGELTSDEVPIVAKKSSGKGGGLGGLGSSSSYTYFISHYYNKSSWGSTSTALKGSASYSLMMNSSEISAEATKGVSNSGDWTHIALVQVMSTTMMMKKPSLTLYINGTKAATGESNITSNQTPSIATSTEALLIGSTGESESGFGGFGSGSAYFNGLIDSIRISNTAKYDNNFTPAKLSAESDTVAFWDFNGNTNDSKGGLNGTPTDITYSTDCK